LVIGKSQREQKMRRSKSKLLILLVAVTAGLAPSMAEENIMTCGELNKLGFQDFAEVTI
jgi:hypothetical protein